MSLKFALWYQGILKQEYRSDMRKIFEAGSWNCKDTGLSLILNEAFWGTTISFTRADRAPRVWLSPEFGFEPSFDEQTGLLRFWAEWSTRGAQRVAMLNMENYILPALTETLVSCHGWIEPAEGQEDRIVDISGHFKKKMAAMSTMQTDIKLHRLISRFY